MKFGGNADLNKYQLLNALLQIINGDHASPVEGLVWYDSGAQAIKFRDSTTIRTLGVAGAGGDATTLDGLDSTAFVQKNDYNAFTVLAADTDNVPAALTVGTSTIVGRKSSGGIVALTAAELITILLGADGTGSLFDADLLDGQQGTHYLDRANHSGTQSADTVVNGTTNKVFTTTEQTKLAGIATGATANATDAQLRDRSTHTGTQVIATIAAAATARIFGRVTASAGPGEELTAAQVKTMLAVVAADISDFNTAVRTNRLDQMAAPTAAVSLNTQKITSLGAPTADTDAATKLYVDTLIQGLAWKDAARAATTANITLSGTQTIDGVACIANDRVLVKNQSTASQNGIYLVAAGAWSRSEDASTALELESAAVMVEEGSTLAGTQWVQTLDNFTLDVGAVTWVQFGGGSAYTAGAGLALTTNDFSVNVDTTTIEINADTLRIAATAAGNGLSGGGGTALAVATDGTTIEVNADQVRLAAGAAGNGLTGGAGSALAVGAGTGISVAADAVSVDLAVVPRKYAVTVGNGSLTSINVDHNLNTLDVQVQVYEVSTGAQWLVDNARTTVNRVVLTFGVAPTSNQFRVVVIG